tara:strand:- start:834 stop:1064 length:231 start_codon:yes stop_codon:yes gene_type:complete
LTLPPRPPTGRATVKEAWRCDDLNGDGVVDADEARKPKKRRSSSFFGDKKKPEKKSSFLGGDDEKSNISNNWLKAK